jgi:hypothetical protein
MAYVNSSDSFIASDIPSKETLERVIKGLLIDELSAQNLYAQVIEAIRKTPEIENKDYIIGQLIEIMHDEQNHSGRLIKISMGLNSNFTVNFQNGFNNKE